MKCIVLPIALLAWLVMPVAADVLVVDAGGGADFTSVSSAINTAVDGDVVLVRPGNYGSGPGSALILIDKGITVTGDGTGPVTVGPITVTALSAGKTLVLRNLRVQLPVVNSGYAGLSVHSSPGRVWVENCTLPGQNGYFTLAAFPAAPGVRITDSGDVLLLRSTVTGGVGVDSFFPYAPTPGRGGHGVEVSGSGALTLHECQVAGGRGGDFVGFSGGPGPGARGGDAVSAPDGEVLVSGSQLVGGNAGDGDELVGSYQGGDGLDAPGPAAAVRVKDTSITPGAGGLDGSGNSGPPGAALDVPDGSLTTYNGSHRSYQLSGPTPEDSLLHLSYRGELGDYIGVFVSLTSLEFPLDFEQGTWVLGPPLFGPYILGAVSDPSGVLELDAVVPDFGLGPEDAVVLLEQVYLQDTLGRFLISSPATHIIVSGAL